MRDDGNDDARRASPADSTVSAMYKIAMAQWWHRWVLKIWRGLLHLYVYVWRDLARDNKRKLTIPLKMCNTIRLSRPHFDACKPSSQPKSRMNEARSQARFASVQRASIGQMDVWRIRECSGGWTRRRWKFTVQKIGWSRKHTPKKIAMHKKAKK